jgi:hypothetical protein
MKVYLAITRYGPFTITIEYTWPVIDMGHRNLLMANCVGLILTYGQPLLGQSWFGIGIVARWNNITISHLTIVANSFIRMLCPAIVRLINL